MRAAYYERFKCPISIRSVVEPQVPENGVVILTPPKMTPPLNTDNNRILASDANLGLPKMTPGQNDTTQNDTTSSDKMGGDKLTPLLEERINKQSGKWVQNGTTQNDTPLKEDSLKDSLSPDPVEAFYTGIGQTKISKAKREKGIKVVQELKADGFSLDDIAYAAGWTPENAKEEVYDISVLKHTIGQAISARRKEQKATYKVQKESARVRAAEEEERLLETEILKIRKGISKAELDELRERALEEIRNTDGVKEQFISEPLITAKENEILRRS